MSMWKMVYVLVCTIVAGAVFGFSLELSREPGKRLTRSDYLYAAIAAGLWLIVAWIISPFVE